MVRFIEDDHVDDGLVLRLCPKEVGESPARTWPLWLLGVRRPVSWRARVLRDNPVRRAISDRDSLSRKYILLTRPNISMVITFRPLLKK